MAALENKTYDAGGGRVVYWSLNGDSDYEKLRLGCEAAGLTSKTLPEDRSALSALRHGIDRWVKTAGLRNVLVRPLSQGDGYDVVSETVGEDRNEYQTSFSARVDVKERRNPPRVVTGSSDCWSSIVEWYNEALDRASQEAVGGYLSRVVYALGGTALRPNGGVYWLPESSIDRFNKVVESIESAGTHAVFTLSVAKDQQLARSIVDAITNEVTTEADYIESEVASRDLGERALKTRIVRAKLLLEKVRDYEATFGKSLSFLSQRVEQVETQCAVLAIQRAAVAGE